MSRIRFVTLFFVLALAFGPSAFSASTITYAVGTCRPGLRSFHTISRALAAVPSANFVVVCPGTYREQPQITHSVTLEGVSNGTSTRVIIAPPASGLVINAMDDFAGPAAAQLWVNNAFGAVNISDLTVDASGNGVVFADVIGIFYQNSSGTVNRVATRNQSSVPSPAGFGIFAQGGSSNPLVTIENSSVRDYDLRGIEVDTNSASAPEITAVIRGNEVTNSTQQSGGGGGIIIGNGAAATVTSNIIVNPGVSGIFAFGSMGSSTGSISANIVANAFGVGIDAEADLIPVTFNKILGSPTGIYLGANPVGINSKEAIQSNTISDSTMGIDFVCNADPNVHSNIISDTGTALNEVPSALVTSNTYFNVGTIRTGGC